MKDYQAHLETLRRQAAEAALISDLATVPHKRELLLAGFDFSFQPSLDRNRILALAQLDFIGRNEVIHFLGRPAPARMISPPRSGSRKASMPRCPYL